MPTLEEVQEQIGRMDGFRKFLGRREIKELPNILWEDEQIEKVIQGLYDKGNGLLVATNKRLIFVDKGFLGAIKVEDFPYDKISSIQYSTGMMFGKITIFTSGNKADIEQLDRKATRDFAEYVRARVTKQKEHASAPRPQAGPADDDIVTKLERLAKLRDQGILTEDEFQAQKQKLLS